MSIHVTEVTHPFAQSLLTTLRDKNTPPHEFARDTKLLGEMLFLEALAKGAPTASFDLHSPLEPFSGTKLNEQDIKLVAVLRAGLGIMAGARKITPSAACGMISESRDHLTKKPTVHHISLPPLKDKHHIFLCEPMLATGRSAAAALKIIRSKSLKARICVLALIVAPEAISEIETNHELGDIEIFTASLDRCLDKNSYILPGLGDAGDRIFATSL